MVNEIFNGVLIWDLETAADLGKSTSTHKLRVFGCYSFDDEKYYLLYDKNEIRNMINRHKYLVGFNSVGGVFHGDVMDGYDTQVMYYNGFSDMINKDKDGIFRFKNKVNFDLLMLFKKRSSAMKVKAGMLNDLLMRYSLDFISRTIGVVDDSTAKIDDFDYSLLKKEPNEWTDEEKILIEDYTMRDLEVTKKMYEWCEDYFKSFRDYVPSEDVEKKTYLTCSTAVFTYKSICNAMGWKEEYSNVKDKVTYGGGYVSFPSTEHATGKIYCLDFNSLYPSIMHQCNIFSPDPNGWDGNGKFKVEGKYNKEKQGDIEKLIKSMYEDRVVFKKNGDAREYSLKIQLNAAYGLLGNPCFANLYNRTSAADVTRIGRQWIKLSRKKFMKAGYDVIYTDTDSCYLVDPFDDKEKMLGVKDEIIKEIKDNVPFPYEHFDMGIDDEITDMWFFKGDAGDKVTDSEMDKYDYINKPKKLIKKNYIYRTIDGKIKVKNLGVRKKSLSAITRKLFWEILVPRISKERKVKFSETYLRNLINELLQTDISLAEIRYTAKPADSYKSESQIQAQISRRYGPGIHFLIPNTRGIGVGLKKNYCTIEEFKEHNLSIDDIDLTNVWKELKYFIKSNQSLLTDFFVVNK